MTTLHRRIASLLVVLALANAARADNGDIPVTGEFSLGIGYAGISVGDEALEGEDALKFDPTLTFSIFPDLPQLRAGFGVGVLWVPITMVSFSTLAPAHLAEASAVYHMVRNIGSSIHISLSITLAVHMARTGYAEIAERVTPYSQSLSMPWVTGAWNLEDTRGLAALSREMTRQAAMIGYVDAFVFFIATSLVVLPLVLLIRIKR